MYLIGYDIGNSSTKATQTDLSYIIVQHPAQELNIIVAQQRRGQQELLEQIINQYI